MNRIEGLPPRSFAALAAARRVWNGLRWEVVLQWRNGFYAATGFLMLIWLVLFTQLPPMDLTAWLPGILAGNLLVGTFYFMAGLVMLERTEGSLEARIVTPLRVGEFLLTKVLALAGLALAENLLVLALFSRGKFFWPGALLGLLAIAALLSLGGFLAVLRYESINRFIMPSVLWVLALLLPLVDAFGLWRSPLFYLHPLQAGLVLLQGAFRPLSAWEWGYGLGYSALALAGLTVLCRRAFRAFAAG